ncbi:MAG: DUF362 domain-containing protein [Ruminococcaceae bacterium]|nr:DUF362 domain-containing protein [Oscillospiraceae bacterium]
MAESKVYFADLRTKLGESILVKMERLIRAAGIDQIDFEDKFVAIKMHFGELGNLAFLRPNYAKVVADIVKSLGGKPYLTDCNTLYVGSRKNALEHLDTANLNGFSPMSTGCQVIIADGIKGTDDVEVPIEGAEFCPAPKIGRAIMDCDVFISLNHFKGHEETGFGGALKNIGMGCGSRRGKMEMHNAGKPVVNEDLCIGCKMCSKFCAHDAAVIENGKATIYHDRCVGCGRCVSVCPKDAVETAFDEAKDVLHKKIAEYSKAVIQDKPNFHISIVRDVSPYCDCHAENDAAIVPNVGMFASFDPVALDMACADAVNSQPILANTLLSESKHQDRDHFGKVFPTTNWRVGPEYAEKIGLGSREYELITVK